MMTAVTARVAHVMGLHLPRHGLGVNESPCNGAGARRYRVAVPPVRWGQASEGGRPATVTAPLELRVKGFTYAARRHGPTATGRVDSAR